MLNTYIKNVGSTQTMIGNRCQNHIEEVNWNADYDGNEANILIRTNNDGNKHKYHFNLDNDDLANLLNIDSVNIPIHKRLKADFKKPVFRHDPNIYRIEIPRSDIYKRDSSSVSEDSQLSELLNSSSPNSFLSSPSPNEEFVVPITINQPKQNENLNFYKKYTFTPRRRNLTLRTHKTHRVYKRPKSSKRRKSSRR
jgi:hypothetical protein